MTSFYITFLPEIFVSVALLIQLLVNIRVINNPYNNYPILIKETFGQTLAILICTFFLFTNHLSSEFVSYGGYLVSDNSIITAKIFVTIVAIVVLFLVQESLNIQKINFYEYFTLYLISILSIYIMISSGNFLVFYLAMEMQALCYYVLASMNRTSVYSAEAGLKYFVSGSFISGVFLLGVSYLYGALGTLDLQGLSLICSFPLEPYSVSLSFLVSFSVILVVVTLLFKLGCAPFHKWSVDVYDGAPLASTIIFSLLPKFSFIIVLTRVIYCFIPIMPDVLPFILIAFGTYSVIVGTLGAFRQDRVKRLLVMSSVAQTGFVVSGLAGATIFAFANVYFFYLVYIITSIISWSAVVLFYLSHSQFSNYSNRSLYLSDLANFSSKGLGLFCFIIALAFFSSAGVPPMAGFVAKFSIIKGLVDNAYTLYAGIIILTSCFSAYYYIRIVKIMFFEPTTMKNKLVTKESAFHVPLNSNGYIHITFIIAICTFFLFYMFYNPTIFMLICEHIAFTAFI